MARTAAVPTGTARTATTSSCTFPSGTQVFDEEDQLIADLARPESRVVVARGGAGGRGNRRFAGPTRQTPRFAETGLPGEEATLELRLKLLADAALVGLPNAGKSSLLRRISNAKPKVADYPFTTIAPVLGTVDSPDGRQVTVADVPGLIEGASEGIGLGHEFLAHLERARLLLHVIDAADGDPVERFRAIDHELQEYGAGLEQRPQVVVLNKIDLLAEPPELELDDARLQRVLAVSAATGAGVEELKRALFELLPPEEERPEQDGALTEFLVYRPRPSASRRYRILRTDRGFRVTGTPPQGEELRPRSRGRRPERSRGRARRRDARVGMTGLFGGAFNPPHLGHLELARRALEEFDLDEPQILVSGDPGHKRVECPVEERVALAKLAFADLPRTVVRADPYRYTIDLLRAEQPDDAIFLMGADQYRDFATWKEPEAVLERVQLGVATRAGVERPRFRPSTRGASASSRSTRRRSPPATCARALRRGESVDGLVTPAVAAEISRKGLYRGPGLH